MKTLAEQILEKKEPVDEGKIKKDMMKFLNDNIDSGDDARDLHAGWKLYWNNWAKVSGFKEQDPAGFKAMQAMLKAGDEFVKNNLS